TILVALVAIPVVFFGGPCVMILSAGEPAGATSHVVGLSVVTFAALAMAGITFFGIRAIDDVAERPPRIGVGALAVAALMWVFWGIVNSSVVGFCVGVALMLGADRLYRYRRDNAS
ncbi:MAG: hypothetical protein ABI459_02730, partial [Deltaproteobacteria bacterium]